MAGVSDERGGDAGVAWRRLPPSTVSSPIVQRVPWLEVKLEHGGIEATARGDRFFPDVVPYTLDGTARVFYWRPALARSSDEPEEWVLACATTHELRGIGAIPSDLPPLVTHGENGVTLVVDGTVGGETTTALVDAYDPPAVRVDRVSESAVELTVSGESYDVDRGERRRITLAERSVEPIDADGGPTRVTPELAIRYPGHRELHHPAPGADYRLFPSFGLDLEDLPNPMPVPTAAGELDDGALAESLGADLSDRPYPERVLWQAFAYTAFDPHAETVAGLSRPDDDHIALLPADAASD